MGPEGPGPQRALNRPPQPTRPPPTQTWEPIDDRLRPILEAPRGFAPGSYGAPLTKRQLKHRQNKDSKLAKKFKSLEERSII